MHHYNINKTYKIKTAKQILSVFKRCIMDKTSKLKKSCKCYGQDFFEKLCEKLNKILNGLSGFPRK